MKKIMAWLMTGLLILSLVACSNEADEKIKVGTWKTAQTIQPFFYQDYLKDNQAVSVLPFTNPGDMKAALLAGSLDACGSTLVTALTAAAKDEPLVVVAGLCNKSSALVVGRETNIQTEADLKNKKIAYVPGTIHHLLLLEVLEKNNLNSRTDVELIRLDFFDMGPALAQKTIDAFYSGEPYPSIAVLEGYGRILSYPDDKGLGTINSLMITTSDKVKNEPQKIQALVSAHIEATELLKKDKLAWFKKAEELGISNEVMEISAPNIELFWEIDPTYRDQVDDLALRMKEQGLIQELPDIDKLFDLQFIEPANKHETDKN